MNDIDVMSTLRNLLLSIFYAPLLLQLRFGDGKKTLAELENGCRLLGIEKQRFKFGYLISHYPEWKNLIFYRRYRFRTNFLQYIYKPYDTFFIRCPEIGDGMMLWHPFSTIISCERIGKNFTIRNNITIGNKGTSGGNRPVIGDNVDIGVNCSIIGNIRIGNNVTIGAGSVIVKDVPDKVVIAGNPAKILKYKSSK